MRLLPHRVDHLSRITHAGFRGPAGSTRCLGLLGLLSKVPRGPPALPGDSRLVLRSRGVHHHPRATHARVRGPVVVTSCPGRIRPLPQGLRSRPAVPGDSGPGPMSRGVDQLSMATWARVPGPVISTSSPRQILPLLLGPRCSKSCPGPLRPRSEVLRNRPALPGESCCGPRASGVDHLPRGTREQIRGAAGSTSSPRRLGLVSNGPRC